MATDRDLARNRLALGGFGAVAGLCLWLLFDRFDDFPGLERILLLGGGIAVPLFGGVLAMTGPLAFGRALRAALPLAVVAGGLLLLASFRFASVRDYLGAWHPVAAYLGVVCLVPPFLVARETGPGGWNDYAALFREAWSIVVRGATALLFVGVFWLVYALSDTLLGLVDVDVLGDLAGEGWFAATLSGAVLGMALAVLNELAAYLSPSLVLRLLRLLLPVVAAVVTLFLLLVPVRGLEDAFGGLSAAAVLLAMAIGAITLVAAALDDSDDMAAESALMLGAAQLVSLLLPVLAGLAAYAVWLRVEQYGWTPDRLVAAVAAAAVMGYALLYAGSVALRGRWMARIRRGNVAMAVGIVAVAALWLTPVINAERLSAKNQVARFAAGETPVAALDLWSIGRDWGKPGKTALAELRAMTDHPEHAVLMERLDALSRAESRYAFANALPADPERAARLSERLRAAPDGRALPDGFVARLAPATQAWADESCARALADGSPGCTVLFADLVPAWAGEEALLFLDNPGRMGLRVRLLQAAPGGYRDAGDPLLYGARLADMDPDVLIPALRAGAFSIGTPDIPALRIENGPTLVPRP